MSDDKYVLIGEGKWKGVSYNISSAAVEIQNGHPVLKFDYDVKGLDDTQSIDFERFLGEMLVRLIEEEKVKDCGIGF